VEDKISEELHRRLKKSAESIARLDVEMQSIYKEINQDRN